MELENKEFNYRVEGLGIGSSPGLCERFWGVTLNSWSAFTVSHVFLPCQQIPKYVLTNCELSRFGNILHVKGWRRHAEPYHAQVFWRMLCWRSMTMPWSLPQELIVQRPFWQYQFSCNFSMFPWLWAKNIQHLVQQSGLTTDSVYPVKSQWYRQYSKEKKNDCLTYTAQGIPNASKQSRLEPTYRVSCSSSAEEPSFDSYHDWLTMTCGWYQARVRPN